MRKSILLPILALILLWAPSAAAYPAPALYFLRDGPNGPAEDGRLDPTTPNGTEPTLRPVPVAAHDVRPILFEVIDADERPRLIRGPVWVGLWTDASPVLNATLVATLQEIRGETLIPLATGRMELAADPDEAPNATALVPPDPSDPEGSALHVVSQVLPVVITPPRLLVLGQVDLEIEAGSSLGVTFHLTNSTGQPLPAGAFATLRYDSELSPSYAFVPWYEPDPPAPTPATPTTRNPTTSPRTSATTSPPSGGDSPGPGLFLLAGALAAAVAIARRRRD